MRRQEDLLSGTGMPCEVLKAASRHLLPRQVGINSANAVNTGRGPCHCAAVFAEFFVACFAFLDIAALLNCERVCRDWHRVLQGPVLWGQFYCLTWRRGRVLPLRLSSCALFKNKIRRMCKQRLQVPIQVSTRAPSCVRANGTVFLRNSSLCRDFVVSCVESARSEQALAPMPISRLLSLPLAYFEATIMGTGSVGIVSLSSTTERMAYGFGSEAHVGWLPVSYGFHGGDGHVYSNTGRVAHDAQAYPYSSPWGECPLRRQNRDPQEQERAVVIGCGYIMTRQQLFFTRDSRLLGVAPVVVESARCYAAAVSLHSMGDTATINFGRSAFIFDIDAYTMAVAKETRLQRTQQQQLKENDGTTTAPSSAPNVAT